jgi:hypothetical protein
MNCRLCGVWWVVVIVMRSIYPGASTDHHRGHDQGHCDIVVVKVRF